MPETPEPRSTGAPGSMSLLVDMATASLDPEYQDARARRPVSGSRTGRPDDGSSRRRAAFGRVPMTVAALLLLAGLLTGTAASQVRQRVNEASAVRASLVAEIRQQTRATDALARQEGRLRGEVAQIRATALGVDGDGRALAARLSELELATGGTAVRGPGLVVTLSDAPGTGGATGTVGNTDGRIYDRDLQEVVNALWTAGAEQLAVNGQRLTAQTTIRSAGEAVLVDFRPISPPYELQAIGAVDTMEPRFVDGAVARRFQTWTSLYGIGFSVERRGTLHLPAASPPDLRLVRPTTSGSTP
ncbi:MAG: hypothetical protein JWM40_1130 [Frankiales bacterium]|nr:hypothetical protein [Frankiales bacterium]